METPQVITIERHILESERLHPAATGQFTNLLYDIALAGKVIASQLPFAQCRSTATDAREQLGEFTAPIGPMRKQHGRNVLMFERIAKLPTKCKIAGRIVGIEIPQPGGPPRVCALVEPAEEDAP